MSGWAEIITASVVSAGFIMALIVLDRGVTCREIEPGTTHCTVEEQR